MNFSHKVTGPQRKKLSFHDEALAEIGESQFVNTDEMPRSSRGMTLIKRLRLLGYAVAKAMAHRQAVQ
jgi:hypothetical protein